MKPTLANAALHPKQWQVVVPILSVSTVFAVCALLALKYGDGLTVSIIGVLASILTPALGAMVTLLIVTPLRQFKNDAAAIKDGTDANGEKIDEVHGLVDGRMSTLIAQIGDLQTTNTEALRANVELLRELTSVKDELRDLQNLTFFQTLANSFARKKKT
jgi:hypothetical protein